MLYALRLPVRERALELSLLKAKLGSARPAPAVVVDCKRVDEGASAGANGCLDRWKETSIEKVALKDQVERLARKRPIVEVRL